MGDYTLQQAFEITRQYFPTRFKNRDRDVIKRIAVKQVTEISRHDLPGEPRIFKKFIIESKSYPNYPPYFTGHDSRGRITQYQRRIAHHYDVTLEINDLSLSSKNWKLRIGSGKKWNKRPSQAVIKSLYPVTVRRLKRKASHKPNPALEYKRLVKKHKDRAKYLDVGDYNSQVNGLNGDWIFRCDFAYYVHDHRYGRNYYGDVPAHETNPNNLIFLPKHAINVLEVLMEKGILSR